MRMTAALTTCAVLAAAVTGCAGEPESAYERFSVETTSDSVVGHAPDDASATLVLWVSNQSFRQDDVGITVRIDTVPVIDGEFPVQDENNWVHFPLTLEPGQHELVAQTTSGVSTVQSFSTPSSGSGVHAVLSYWFPLEDGSRPFFGWELSEEPLQFG